MDSKDSSTKNITIISAGNATESLEVKDAYSKEVRKKIDDVSKRKKFKEQTFDGRKTIEDPYTGEVLHSDSKAAMSKYGKNNMTKHTADVDHIVPAETVYERTKNNPFLTTEDIKEIANHDKNYKLINSKTNRSKQSKSNRKYVKEHKESLTKHQQHEMIKDEIKAEISINNEIVQKTIHGAHSIGVDAAKAGMKVGAGVSAAQNITKVIQGEQTWEDAGVSIVIDTAKASAVSYVSGIGNRVIESAALQVGKNAGAYITSSVNQFIQSGGPAKTLAIMSDVGAIVIKFINGDIDNKELTEELGEKGTSLAMSFAAGGQGAAIGGFLGAIVGSAIPGAGTVIGGTIGATVGEIVGNMVGYMIGSEICKALKEGANQYDADLERKRQLTMYYNSMSSELDKKRIELEESLEAIQLEYRTVLKNAFVDMRDAILNNDADAVTAALQTICEKFGINVAFSSREQFDSFMLDEFQTIKIGRH